MSRVNQTNTQTVPVTQDVPPELRLSLSEVSIEDDEPFSKALRAYEDASFDLFTHRADTFDEEQSDGYQALKAHQNWSKDALICTINAYVAWRVAQTHTNTRDISQERAL